MTATFQPGAHPDSRQHPEIESLSAFAEQALGEHERSQLLAHLAICPRCRQIVALAHEPVGEEIQLVAAAVPSRAAYRDPRHSNARRKSWVFTAAPLAALAASAVFVLFLHHERVDHDADVAKNTPPYAAHVESLTASASQPDRERPAPPSPQAVPESKKLPVAAEAGFDRATEARQRSAGQQPSQAAPPPPSAPPVPAAATEAVTVAAGQPSIETISPDQASAISQSATTQSLAVLKTPPLPASRSTMQQSQAAQQQAFQRANASMQSQQNVSAARFAGALQAKAASPAGLHGTAGAAATNASAPTTVNRAATVSPGPLAPTAESGVTRFGAIDSVTASATSASVSRRFHLPGGLTSISVASAGPRMFAIDSTGACFLSLDSGVTWQPVAAQWAGRAVLVRIVPNTFAAAAGPATTTGSGQAAGTPQAAATPSTFTFFEILNDKNQTWRSTDGVTWLAK